MIGTKPFTISKQLVMQAFQLVKANGGAAGVDQQSLAGFEKDLKDNLYKLWNPALGKVRSNSQHDSIKACLSWLGAGCLVPDSEIMVPLSPPLLPISETGWQFRRVGLRNK